MSDYDRIKGREAIARAAVAATSTMCAILAAGIPCYVSCTTDSLQRIEEFIRVTLEIENGIRPPLDNNLPQLVE